ncbi:MAG: hypothetical protein GY758_12430 [Fuerstiella sp.]|jgi:ligand-binding SRPBCC domain-containing protein|nr:hypothetical protein [Fuerstiella sp.]MCP4506814.1 hypothetical protein [Fuerstiella sp.]MDG2129671.1 hypothetical protein [Fuerstiella sp.]
MPVFDFRFTVDAPVDAVSAFHFESGILKTLTPPLMILQVHRFEPLGEGSVSDFTMWMGLIPIRWKAVHANVSASGFTDTQVTGPMHSWTHTHSFVTTCENTTEVHEHIEYEHSSGLRGLRSRILFSSIGLLALFTMRKVITRREVNRRMEQGGPQK